MELIEKFPNQVEILRGLFQTRNADVVTPLLDRLNTIYLTCEEKWLDNLKRLDGIAIKYILIAEAAPWTEEGEVRYFYNTFDGNWVKRIWNTFYNNRFPNDAEFGLACLAKKQFLLIDSLQ